MVGQTISHYRITDKLGAGGMGVVYKAEDTKLQRTVALKFLAPHLVEDEEGRERFLREARAAAALDHNNICTVHEIDEVDGQVFLAMAFIKGQSLQQKIAGRPLKLEEALDLAIQTARGLQAAHEKGTVHRDIKPANVMVTKDGQVKILDFGLAQLAGRTRLTKSGSSLGTPAYMSPEQTLRTKVDHRSDIWSLGAVLYEMVSGQVPFEGEIEAAVAYAIVNEEPEPLTALRRGVPVELDEIVVKALAKDPDERYQHVEEIAIDLSALLRSLESASAEDEVPSAAPPERKPGLARRLKDATTRHKRIRFGAFEADPHSGELRKNGIRVQLQDQPFRVLALLLSRPGRVVSREKLRRAIWPDDTFVDFDHSLNTAINKIREALGASASDPRYIETIPRRGYRFIFSLGGSRVVTSDRKDFPKRRLALSRVFAAAVVVLACVVALIVWMTRPPPSREYKLTRLTFDAGETTQPTISPDAKLVAYVSERAGEGNPDLWLQQIGGGPPIRLTDHKAVDDSPTFSPDGSQIAFRSLRELGGFYLMPTLGGKPKLHTPGMEEGRFSPDGRWIAGEVFRDGSYGIGIVPLTGGSVRELQPENLADIDHRVAPVWLPDSQRVLFFAGPQEQDWYVADIDGGPAVKTGAMDYMNRAGLSDAPALTPSGWFPDREAVIFSAKEGNTINLWTIPLSPETGKVTGEPQRLTTGPGKHRRPSISADGRLVFAVRNQKPDLWSLPLDANRARVIGKLKRLTDDPYSRPNFAMSMDGDKMVFVSDRAGNNDVWIRDMETGEETRLTDSSEGETPSAFSIGIAGDGSQVVYITDWTRKITGYVVSTRGGAPRKICDDCSTIYGVSRTGQLLLYRRMVDTKEFWLLDIPSQERVRLLHHPEAPLWRARLSPDDRWVAFSSMSLYVAPLRGLSSLQIEDWIRVTRRSAGNTNFSHLSWSPDGNLLYYNLKRGGRIWTQRLDPETKEPVGSPIEVYRLQNGRRHIGGMQVAANQIVLNLVETQSDIWMMEPRTQH